MSNGVTEATHISRFTMILMSPVPSPSVTLVGHTTNFLRYEWLENSVFQKVPKRSHTSCFTMILMSLVHSGSFLERTHTSCLTMNLMCPLYSATLSLVRRTASILRYEWHEDSAFQKIPETTFLLFYDDIYIFCTFCKFQQCTTQDKFSPSWVLWELSSSKSTGGNSYLPFWDDFCLLYILQVWVLYDAQQVFSVMSDVRTELLRKCRRQLILPVL